MGLALLAVAVKAGSDAFSYTSFSHQPGNLKPFCALNVKQCGSYYQDTFLAQSISQSASTYWNICYVPGPY